MGCAYPYPVCTQLNLAQIGQAFQTLNCTDLILHEEQVFELGEVVDSLDVLDLVEGQVQQPELGALVKPTDVRDEVVIEVGVFEIRSDIVGDFYMGDLVLAETEALQASVSI